MKLFILAALALAAQAPADHDNTTTELATGRIATQANETRHTISSVASKRHSIRGPLSRIAVVSARNRSMQIYLYDVGGKLLASDLDSSDGLSLGVRRSWKGPFTLVVRNSGRRANLYSIKTE